MVCHDGAAKRELISELRGLPSAVPFTLSEVVGAVLVCVCNPFEHPGIHVLPPLRAPTGGGRVEPGPHDEAGLHLAGALACPSRLIEEGYPAGRQKKANSDAGPPQMPPVTTPATRLADQGIEPRYAAPKAAVLPLDQSAPKSGRQDSNLRPRAPKARTLPD
jgi:hypothetical protein